MASAPSPSAVSAAQDNRKILRIRIGTWEPVAIAINNVSMAERLVCRKATGLPLEAFLTDGAYGADSLMVLWWLARRGAGEPMLTFTQAADQWPADLTEDDVELTIDETAGEADHPES